MRLIQAFVIFTSLALFAAAAEAACVTSAPNGSTLDIYGDPLANRPVIGGVAVGQCTLEVTPTCSGNFCQVYLGSLSGWADMQHVNVAANEPGNSSFIYEITGGGGTITFLGRTQPTPVEPGGKVIFTLLDDGTMRLTLPPESQMPYVIMQRTGSSSFTGAMPNWGGFPVTVEVIAEPVSAPKAILDFIANNAQVKMEMSMNLTRTNSPILTTTLDQVQQSTEQPSQQQSGGANSALCLLAADVSAATGIEEGSVAQSVYKAILDRVGIDFRKPTDEQCQAVLDASLNEGVLCELVNTVGLPPNFAWGPVQINANGGTVNRIPARFCPLSQAQGRGQPGTSNIKQPGSSNAPGQVSQDTTANGSVTLCDTLSTAIGPILREGNGSSRRRDLMGVLKSVGVFDLASATTGECRQISIDLVRIGLISEDAIDLTSTPLQGGEDPNTMIEGGVEIAGSEQDFAPATPNRSSDVGANSGCVAFADQVLKIISLGTAADLSILQIVLSDIGMTGISGKSARQCRDAEAMLLQRGLVK